jgi:hypothetical protein
VYWAVLLLPCWAVGKEIGQGKKEKGSGALGWAEAEGREGPGLRAKDGEGKGFFFPFSFVCFLFVSLFFISKSFQGSFKTIQKYFDFAQNHTIK